MIIQIFAFIIIWLFRRNFFHNLPGKEISLLLSPFLDDDLWKSQSDADRSKTFFLHFNFTIPFIFFILLETNFESVGWKKKQQKQTESEREGVRCYSTWKKEQGRNLVMNKKIVHLHKKKSRFILFVFWYFYLSFRTIYLRWINERMIRCNR